MPWSHNVDAHLGESRSGTPTDYGIDAPGFLRGVLAAGVGAIVVAVAAVALIRSPWGGALAAAPAVAGLYCLGMAGFMVFESRLGKIRTRDALLDRIAWRGDEAVLDVGCGRGMMLIGAAARLTTGRAIGIDIWRAEDQSAKTADAALANARLAGVADRVEVRTADMRNMPFADASFDVVVTHWAVHNIDDEGGRDAALAEMVRVIRPRRDDRLADILYRESTPRG